MNKDSEIHALVQALAVLRGEADPLTVRLLVQNLPSFPTAQSFEEMTIARAISKICEAEPKAVPRFPSTPAPDLWEDRLFEGICRAWMLWASETGGGLQILEVLQTERSTSRSKYSGGSSLNLMTLYQWISAVTALIQEDPGAYEAFQKAGTLGSEYGTASNPTIQWTLAASFFPRSR